MAFGAITVGDRVDGMHRAWCKSAQLQLALWAKPYSTQVVDEW